MSSTIQGVASIPPVNEDNLLQVVRLMKISLDSMIGQGDKLNRVLTARDLDNLAKSVGALSPSTGGSSSGSSSGTTYDPTTDTATPPPPTSLIAQGAYANIVLRWAPDPATYRNQSFTEVWGCLASDSSVVGGAALLGVSTSNFFTYKPPTNGLYNFWIRSVSQANIAGPYNATAPVQANTSIAGLQAVIADSIVAAELNAAQLTLGDGTVGGNLRSAGYAAGTAGWILLRTGNAEFNNVVVRGTVYADAGSFAGDISAATGTFSGGVRGGALSSFAWPATGSGYFLGPGGLLLGNYNDYVANPSGGVGYFGVEASTGNVYSPNFNIRGGALTFKGSGEFSGNLVAAGGTFKGVLTADAVDAVKTINIAGDTITVPWLSITTADIDTTYTVGTSRSKSKALVSVTTGDSTNGRLVLFISPIGVSFGTIPTIASATTNIQSLLASTTATIVVKRNGHPISTETQSLTNNFATVSFTNMIINDSGLVPNTTYNYTIELTTSSTAPCRHQLSISALNVVALETKR